MEENIQSLPPEIAATLTKMCGRCSATKTLDKFRIRRLPSGTVINKSICKVCEGRQKRSREHGKEAILRRLKAQRTALISSAVQQLTAQSAKAVQLADVVEQMIGQFGSVHDFTYTWYQQIMEAIRKNPGGHTPLQSLLSVAKLAAANSAQQMKLPDADSMTLEDVESELASMLMGVCSSPGADGQQALFAALAEQAGITEDDEVGDEDSSDLSEEDDGNDDYSDDLTEEGDDDDSSPA